jgi:Zn finger protein HypA/HybF involved in hydrogenase expression
MTDFSKAFWNTDQSSISLVMPISKIDQEKRIVSGWATTDAIDKQGDIVTAEASAEAFDKFRGNVRESHTPLAVGKVLSFKQDKYYDKEKNKFQNGVYVDVYISKGAQDTWYKINEGILSGFSIGGNINKSQDMYDEEMDKTVRVIKEYELSELSLVDNPANPNANVVSVQKFMGGETIEKNYLENVFWCSSTDTVILSQDNSYNCPQCTKSMTNIGFVESNDIEKSETVKNLLKSFDQDSHGSEDVAIDKVAKSVAEKNEKEGIDMGILKKKSADAEDIVKSDEVAEEAAEVAEEAAEEVEEATEESVEKSADVEETVDEVSEDVVEKSADVEEAEDAEDTVEKSTTPAESNVDDLAKSLDEVKALVASTVGSVAELAGVVKSIAAQIADTKKSVDNVKEEVGVVKSNVTEFGERVEAAEADTAVRKSGDLGGIVQEEKIEKSMWGGRFLSSADLYR